MNSVIISFVISAARKFGDAFKAGAVCKALLHLYDKISQSFNDSRIMSLLRRDTSCENKGFLLRLVHSPFLILEFFERKFGSFIKSGIENSFIIKICHGFLNFALSMNTRFLGIWLLGVSIPGMIFMRKIAVITGVLGVIFLLFDFSITKALENSFFVKLILKFIGFSDFSWDFYDDVKKYRPVVFAMSFAFGLCSGLLCGTSLIYAVLLPCAAVGMFTVLKYPKSGVFFALLAAPFVPTMILAGLCLFTFLSFLIKSICTGGFKWKVDGLGVCIGLFLIFMLVSSVFSFSPKKCVLGWGMYLIFTGFYFVITNALDNKTEIEALLKVFVLAGVFVALYGILQYVFGWNTSNAWIDEEMFEEATMRAYSTMENPNVLGEYLLLFIPLSAVFFLKKGVKSWERIFYIGAFLLGCLCMVFTQSRGCWLGLLLTAAIFVTFYNGKLWGLLPIALIIIPFIIPETMVERMSSVGNLEDSSTSYRVFIWLGTLKMLKDFWIGGIGMGEGAFRSVYPLYSYNAIIAPHSHNTFLQMIVEGGIATIIIFIAAMIIFIKKMSVGYRKDNRSIMCLALGSGVIGFLLQSMFDYTFYNYRMMAMFFMILAIGSRLVDMGGKNESN